MRNSKLITVLSKISNSEFDRLEKFLDSPFFQEKYTHATQVQKLFKILQNAYPDFEDKDLDKEKIYHKIFKADDKPQKGRLEKLMSYLYKRVEDWIYMEAQWSKASNFNKQASLIEFYFEKGLSNQHANALKKQAKNQQKIVAKGKDELYQNYLMNSTESKFAAYVNAKNSDLKIPDTIEALDIYYLSARLEYTCNLLAQENFHNVLDTNDSHFLLEELMPILTSEKYSNVPLIKVYLTVYEILKTNELDVQLNLKNIRHLETLLVESKALIPMHQIRGLHAFNRSLVMRVLNLGRLELTEAAFELYQSHLERGLLFNGKFILQGTYKNIASIGIMLKKFDWVEHFLKKYKPRLNGRDAPKDVYAFNKANCLFHQHQIAAAYDCLPQHFEDLYYRLAARRLEIKILYEQESDLLDFKLRAFNQYIYRMSNTILPEAARSSNNNFAKLLMRILAPGNASLVKRIKISAQIEKMNLIKEKQWLLSLLQEK